MQGQDVEDNKLGRWYYRDSGGNAQGPFSNARMGEMFKQGYLSQHVALSRDQEGPFATLSTLYANGDADFADFQRDNLSSATGAGGHKHQMHSTDENALQWYFRHGASSGAIQGPFSSKQMRDWVADCTFGPEDCSMQIWTGVGSKAVYSVMRDVFPGPIQPAGTAEVARNKKRNSGEGSGSGRAFNRAFGNLVKSSSPSHLASGTSTFFGGSSSASSGNDSHNSGAQQRSHGKTKKEKSSSGGKQQSVKAKLFSRVTKHRRSNSAGSSADMSSCESRLLFG